MMQEHIQAQILYKLVIRRQWGAVHSQKRNVLKEIPQRYYKEAEDALDYLIKDGFIIQQPKTKELHISLNPKFQKEIFEIIEKWFDKSIVEPYR